MAVGNTPESLAQTLAELLERVRILENSPRANQTSIQNGRMRVLDNAGNLRVLLGKVDEDTNSYGIEAYDENGTGVFRVDEGGLVSPPLILTPYADADWAVTTTNAGAGEVVWRAALPEPRRYEALRLGFFHNAALISTFRYTVRFSSPGGSGTSAPIDSDGYGLHEWNWAPDWSAGGGLGGWFGSVYLHVQRLTGGQEVTVPRPQIIMSSAAALGATPTGL